MTECAKKDCKQKAWNIGWIRADYCHQHVCSGPNTCTSARLPDRNYCLDCAITRESSPDKKEELQLIRDTLPRFADDDAYLSLAQLSVDNLRGRFVEKQKRIIAEAQKTIKQYV